MRNRAFTNQVYYRFIRSIHLATIHTAYIVQGPVWPKQAKSPQASIIHCPPHMTCLCNSRRGRLQVRWPQQRCRSPRSI